MAERAHNETLRRVNEAGADNVMFISVRAANNPWRANVTLNVQARNSSGTISWKTEYSGWSAATRKGGKLIQAGRKHIVDAMTNDGLIAK